VARPPTQFNLKMEDFPKLPKEFEPILGVLNLLSQQVTQALTKQLTRADNVVSQKKVLTVKAPFTKTSFQHTLAPFAPESCLIAQVKNLTADTPGNAITLTWLLSGQDEVTITSISGLVDGKTYEFTLILT
jgi:hypothetical protein